MYNIKISESKDYFLKNEKPFFYLADTIWSAFTNVTEDEWIEYLKFRSNQGFNALQINILPQCDRSILGEHIMPFKLNVEGDVDYYQYNEAYFDKACKMLEIAVEYGFTPTLVLLWCNYAPGSWIAKNSGNVDVIPIDAIKPYIEFAVKTFSKYNPIYLVSGDATFDDEKTIQYYLIALEQVKKHCPHILVSLHSAGENYAVQTEDLFGSDLLDFYMYQSSHDVNKQFYCRTSAELYLNKKVKRPVINGEPCYEGMRFGTENNGRFTDSHVRNAMWQSILSGAKAGFTYGTHGIWSFHKKGADFRYHNMWYMPFEWRTALQFKGAEDVVFGKQIFEQFNMFDLEPANLLYDGCEEIRVAASKNMDKVVVYIPYATEVTLCCDLSGYEYHLVHLSEHRLAQPEVEIKKDGYSIIKMPQINSDILFVAQRRHYS